jgi:hypothetical protein
MKFNDFIVSEEKVRLDPKCWTGKKIGNPKTKVKGGVRVNNCVPAESINEDSKRCMQCGMVNCSCPGDSCKCKPIKGWIPGKGFKKAIDEAANPAQQAAIAIAKKKKAGVDEAAPPGAKAERMVKHIKKSLSKDGKLSDKEKSIAYATAWKAHNKGVTEAMRPVPVDDKGNRIPDRMSSNAPNRPFGQPGDAKSSSQGVVTYTPTGIVHRSNHGDVTPRPRAVPEGSQRVDSLVTDALKIMRGSETSDAVAALKTVLGDREYNSRRGFYNFYVRQLLDMSSQQGMAEDMSRRGFLRGLGAAALGAAGVNAVAGPNDQEFINKVQRQHFDMVEKNPRYAKEHADLKIALVRGMSGASAEMNKQWAQKTSQLLQKYGVKVNEDYNPEYDDEAGMVENNLETLDRAVEGLDDLINSGDNLPEWCQEKIAVAKSMLVSVWDYMYSEEASDEVDPEIDEMFEAMDQLAEEMARKKGVSVDLVWETFEAMDDHMLYETAAWRRKEGKSKKGGLNAKGVASYRRENPGSKLQTAVTTKPSKLKPGSKAAKRRKSFCARMGGVKGPMKKPNGKPTRKALALRKWNC